MATDTSAADGAQAISTCVDASGGAIGMPQLCFEWFPNQIFWLLVTLVVIYLILSRIALPRIASVLAERQGTITNDLAAAEELKLKALEAEEAYHKALAEARAEAGRISAETRAEIKAGLDEAIAKADAEIAARVAESDARIAEIRETAMANVAEVARDTTAALVAALAPGVADDKAIAAAVEAKLKGRAG